MDENGCKKGIGRNGWIWIIVIIWRNYCYHHDGFWRSPNWSIDICIGLTLRFDLTLINWYNWILIKKIKEFSRIQTFLLGSTTGWTKIKGEFPILRFVINCIWMFRERWVVDCRDGAWHTRNADEDHWVLCKRSEKAFSWMKSSQFASFETGAMMWWSDTVNW